MLLVDLCRQLGCRLTGHRGDRNVWEYHGMDPDQGAYMRWEVRCARCRGVLDSGTYVQMGPWS